MLILGVDTSGKQGSIALVECGSGSARTFEVLPLEGGTFSAQLVPQISALLQKYDFTKHQIGAFAVVSGPGSFTGLRVGLAAVKALAEILVKPVVAVSLLEAAALAAQSERRITAILDAGREEIYAGTYEVQNGIATCISEQVLPLEGLAVEFPKVELVTPDEKLANTLAGKGLSTRNVGALRADDIARLGFKKLQRGETVCPEALDATYIRRSEAEIKFAAR